MINVTKSVRNIFLYSAVSIFSRLFLSLVSPNLECHVVLRPHFFEEAFQSILAKKGSPYSITQQLLPNSVVTAIWTRGLLRLSPAR